MGGGKEREGLARLAMTFAGMKTKCKKQKIHHRNFAKDHSIHYYCSPLELHYGGLMGSGWFARV